MPEKRSLPKAVALFALLAFVLAACTTTPGGGGGNSGTAASFSGTVSNYSGPAAELVVRANIATLLAPGGLTQQQSSSVDIGSGSIASDGSFDFDFLNPPPTEALSPFNPICNSGSVTVSDPNARIASTITIEVLDASGVTTGNLIKAVPLPTMPPSFRHITLRFYADRQVSFSGTCINDGATWIYNISLTSGWNITTIRPTGDSTSIWENGDSNSTQWWYVPISLPPVPQ